MAVRRRNPALTILGYVLALVIAAALVKIAFFPAQAGETDAVVVPGADFAEATVLPERGDITAAVTLDASVEQDPAQEARATLTGVVQRLSVADGDAVSQGQVLARIVQETPVPPREVTAADGTVSLVEQKPKVVTADVTAPVAGVVDLRVLKDQDVAVGDTLASVQPSSTSIVATLSPEQRYRLVNAPTDAEVTLRNGPGVFTCTGVQVVTSPGASAPAPGGMDGMGGVSTDPAPSGTPTARVRCAVPEGVTVFPGLAGSVRLVTGEAVDVLLLPTTAVQGLYQTGQVWTVPADGGEPVARDVTLGLTDGTRVEITGGIEEDTEVLEYAPSAEIPQPEIDPVTGLPVGDAAMGG